MWRLEDIVKAVGGTVLKKEKEVFTAISTDSRTIGKGELFIPILGKSFDGHAFIGAALKRSGGGTLCRSDSPVSLADADGTVILVEDTNQALLDLARFKRDTLSGTFISITGSNGKTTTKELLAAMMKKRHGVHFNEKNLNNLIGVPMSILSIAGDPDICILELGTNMPGEIRKLAVATDPDASLITNVNPSHLEGLTSLEGILEEKLDLFRYTREGGKVFINVDDPGIAGRWRDSGRTDVTFGIDNDADFRLAVAEDLGWEGSDIVIASPAGTIRTRTSLLGRHNLYNILAAAAVASTMGVEGALIAEAIKEFHSYDKRFQPAASPKGYVIIDDTYNANPSSMTWAISTLAALPATGKRIAVLGGMKELGEESSRYHRELGAYLSKAGLGLIVLLGEETKDTMAELGGAPAAHFDSREDLIGYVASQAGPGDTILVKGSRAFKMEDIVEALK
ncbi:MAG: UDP-N-acetylmuramoyl-tripeptide--D-alanyl-D-alanine ligase [Syntrophorhabdus sp. PtaB.Bin047]|jgi:UDP-N-acetylmuramoyl-tripeptide--D-alanyl-D-alanine ligase|nr:MAG: UDP-N-acetylmuramoyl-tripeptide--D-alanyl-D-alanine ligase [Syntrophorhabdus sp. PtaB.Bin047]